MIRARCYATLQTARKRERERAARSNARILEKPREREADEKNGGLASEFGKGGEGGEQGAREDGGTKIASFVRPRINKGAPLQRAPDFINRGVLLIRGRDY